MIWTRSLLIAAVITMSFLAVAALGPRPSGVPVAARLCVDVFTGDESPGACIPLP
jgi:hypothetical protein